VVVDLIREALVLEVAGLFWIQPVNDLVLDIAFDNIIDVLECAYSLITIIVTVERTLSIRLIFEKTVSLIA
jgi:hypothetical protein